MALLSARNAALFVGPQGPQGPQGPPGPSNTTLGGRAVSTSSPTSGQVLTWTGSAWAPGSVASNDLVVTQFGLVGDGVTDNTANLITALAAAATTSARLLFPPGVYLLSDNIALPNGVELVGAGWYTYDTSPWPAASSYTVLGETTPTLFGTILKFTGNHGFYVGPSSDGSVPGNRVALRYLALRGPGQDLGLIWDVRGPSFSSGNTQPIPGFACSKPQFWSGSANGSDGIVLEKVGIFRFHVGLSLTNTERFSAKDCSFYGCEHAIDFPRSGGDNYAFYSCHIGSNQYGFTNQSGGEVQFYGGSFLANTQAAVYLTSMPAYTDMWGTSVPVGAAGQVVFEGTHFEGNTVNAIQVDSLHARVQSVMFRGLHISGNGVHDNVVFTDGQEGITDVKFQDVYANGVPLTIPTTAIQWVLDNAQFDYNNFTNNSPGQVTFLNSPSGVPDANNAGNGSVWTKFPGLEIMPTTRAGGWATSTHIYFDVNNAEPLSSGNFFYFPRGWLSFKGNPAPGDSLGWFFTTGGYNIHTNWAGTHSYTIGNLVADSGNLNVFECTHAGTSGSGEPSWNTTPGATTTGDGSNGLIWTCLGPKAVAVALPPNNAVAPGITTIAGDLGGTATSQTVLAMTGSAGVGTLRMATLQFAVSSALINALRNAGGGVYVSMLGTDSSDNVILGGTNAAGLLGKVGSTTVLSLSKASGDYISVGSTAAAAGALRMSKAFALNANNNAGSGDIVTLSTDSSDNVILGGTNAAGLLGKVGSTTVLSLAAGSGDYVSIGNTAATAGALRMSKAFTMNALDNAGTGNIVTLSTDSSDNVILGGTNAAGLLGKVGSTTVLSLAKSSADYISVGGSTVATTGTIRFANNATGLMARNAANTHDIGMIQFDSSNNLSIGFGGDDYPTNLQMAWANGNCSLVGGVGSTLTLTCPTFQFASSTSSPAIKQAASSSAVAGQNLTLAAQAGGTSGSQNGGDLILSSGAKNSSGTNGNIQLQAGGTTFFTFTNNASQTLAAAATWSLTHTIASSGGGTAMTFTTQAAASGSSAAGGDFAVTIGAHDGTRNSGSFKLAFDGTYRFQIFNGRTDAGTNASVEMKHTGASGSDYLLMITNAQLYISSNGGTQMIENNGTTVINASGSVTVSSNSSDVILTPNTGGYVKIGGTYAATGGGTGTAAFAASSVGGTNQPATTTQNGWVRIRNVSGTPVWVPAWV